MLSNSNDRTEGEDPGNESCSKESTHMKSAITVKNNNFVRSNTFVVEINHIFVTIAECYAFCYFS